MSPPDRKRALHAELVRRLRADVNAVEQAHRSTVAGATHEEAKPENDKDTRAIEQQYLARGQAQRAEEARIGLANVEHMALRAFSEEQPVTVGALVTLDADGAERVVFVAPAGGGITLADAVVVVTPTSPLGRALIGKQVGDEIQATFGGKPRIAEIARID